VQQSSEGFLSAAKRSQALSRSHFNNKLCCNRLLKSTTSKKLVKARQQPFHSHVQHPPPRLGLHGMRRHYARQRLQHRIPAQQPCGFGATAALGARKSCSKATHTHSAYPPTQPTLPPKPPTPAHRCKAGCRTRAPPSAPPAPSSP